eukprot:5427605-Prymnesium_polylepis.3
MRGKVRHPFEIKYELEWEVASSSGDASVAKGTLSYADVCPLASGGDAAAASKVSYELAERYTVAPAATERARVETDVSELKRAVDAALETFLADLKSK